jgi:hypothetical protein
LVRRTDASRFSGRRRAGSWNTRFWIDPVTKPSAIFMVQYRPFAFVNVGDNFWSHLCRALAGS